MPPRAVSGCCSHRWPPCAGLAWWARCRAPRRRGWRAKRAPPRVVRYDQTTVSDAVRELTGGEGAAAVYDGVGQATFEESLKCLRPRGMLVLFGASSGQVPPFDLHRLACAGSLFVTRPTLVHYTRDRAELLDRAVQVLDLVANGRLRVHIGGRARIGRRATGSPRPRVATYRGEAAAHTLTGRRPRTRPRRLVPRGPIAQRHR